MNAIDTSAVGAANKALADAYTSLAVAENNYATVKTLNGQNGYSVTVNGVRVDVSCMDSSTYMAAMIRGRDSSTYMAAMIRGREMIHLGALKALQSVIDARREAVREAETRLVKAIGGAA